MNEIEFDKLLDAVRSAISPIFEDQVMLAYLPVVNSPPIAANDNDTAWPLLPFPEGWYAAC